MMADVEEKGLYIVLDMKRCAACGGVTGQRITGRGMKSGRDDPLWSEPCSQNANEVGPPQPGDSVIEAGHNSQGCENGRDDPFVGKSRSQNANRLRADPAGRQCNRGRLQRKTLDAGLGRMKMEA